VTLFELPCTSSLSRFKRPVDRIDVGGGWYIDGNETTRGAFVGALEFSQRNPVP
jgi:hypothetical protein